MRRRKSPKSTTVRRGRRTDAERNSGRWRLSIREVVSKKGAYQWTTYMVQGFQDEAGKWARKKFRTRDEADAFVARLQMANVIPGAPQHPVITRLTPEQVNEAEVAFTRLAGCKHRNGHQASLLDAVTFYAAHLKGTVDVERVSMSDARKSCLRDKEARGVLRHRSIIQLECTLKAFERWLRSLPRYTEQSLDEDWTPYTCEVTTDDIAAYLASLRSRAGLEASPKTKNNVRGDLRGFFNWCIGQEDDRPLPGVKRRWHTTNPAAAIPKLLEKESVPTVMSVKEAETLMKEVEEFKDGKLVPYFALALFAGLRPGPDGELRKLHAHAHRDTPCREAGGRPLIDLARGVLTITADVAKTRRKRVVTIQPNLKKWLVRYGTNILPPGYDRDIKTIRASHSLGHDVLRHSFISFHVAAFRSKAETALQAGNSEAVIDAHYLNIPTEKEGKAFFAIYPAVSDQKIVPMPGVKTA